MSGPAAFEGRAAAEMALLAREAAGIRGNVRMGLDATDVRKRALGLAMLAAGERLCDVRCDHEPQVMVLDHGVSGCHRCLAGMVDGRELPDEGRCLLCGDPRTAGQYSVEFETGWAVIGTVCAACAAFDAPIGSLN